MTLEYFQFKISEPTKQCVENKIDTLNNDKIHVGTIKIHTFISQKQIVHNYSDTLNFSASGIL